MTSRCKPGDLAIIIRDTSKCDSNIGCLVRVSGPAEINQRGQLAWLIQPDTYRPYIIEEYGGAVYVMEPGDNNIEHPDEWMLPIRPEDLPEEISVVSELCLEGDPS